MKNFKYFFSFLRNTKNNTCIIDLEDIHAYWCTNTYVKYQIFIMVNIRFHPLERKLNFLYPD